MRLVERSRSERPSLSDADDPESDHEDFVLGCLVAERREIVVEQRAEDIVEIGQVIEAGNPRRIREIRKGQ